MTRVLSVSLAVLVSSLAVLRADDLLTEDAMTYDLEVSHELTLRGSGTGGNAMQQGNRSSGEIASQDMALKYVASFRFDEGPLVRIGGAWEAFWFERHNSTLAIPARIDAMSAILGFDLEVFDGWLLRLEAQPGFYGEMGDGADWDDINVPFILAGTYIYDKDFQLILGVSVDPWRSFPIIPAAGFRWSFAPGWVANIIPPNPRLELYLSDKTMVYVGADLRSATVRVGPTTGDRGGQTQVNNAILEYTELRAGVGAIHNVTPTFALEAQVGAVPLRRFDYSRTDLTYHASGLAPYGTVSLSAKF